MRDFAKLRIDRANARMKARRTPTATRKPDDPVARLRDRADTMAATAAAMKKIADAADPLYKTLDDGQKRRLAVLTHHGRPVRPAEAGAHGGFFDRDDGPRPGHGGHGRDDGSDRMGPRDGGAGRRAALSAAACAPIAGSRQKPLKSGGFFAISVAEMAGEYLPVCWTSPGRFAKRRPLAKDFPDLVPGA